MTGGMTGGMMGEITGEMTGGVDRPALLLVDDEEGIRSMLSLLLEDMGYAVESAASAPEALEAYRRLRPDIVMTDVKMPGMGGIELLQAVKAENGDAEVIMLTGHGDMDLAVSSLRHGAGDFLHKPVSEEALLVALERAKERIAMRAALRRHTEELEALVRERTRDLIRSERFAAVGESAAALAHSIKNIAGALEGTMFVLEKGLELNKREYFEEGWKMIRSDLGRLRVLALNMLDMGRGAPLAFAPEVPGKPAREVLELLAARAREAGVELEMEDAAGDRPFIMAAEAVHQCLLNLVLNGIEALAGNRIDAAAKGIEAPSGQGRRAKPAAEGGEGVVGHGRANTAAKGGEGADGPGATPAQDTRGTGRVAVFLSRERGRDGRECLRYIVRDNGPGLDDGLWPERGESPVLEEIPDLGRLRGDGSGPEGGGMRPGREELWGQAFGSGKEGGSGIGLFATRKLAHDMGAELVFRPAPERGAEAEIRLFEP